jgi:hypothetical protein
MEYITNYKRRPDSGRRILFPSSWLDSNTRFFFFKNEVMDKAPYPIWELYPYQKWIEIMNKKTEGKERFDWSDKTKEYSLDKNSRLLLPLECKWKIINLIGMVDYIIIKESTS